MRRVVISGTASTYGKVLIEGTAAADRSGASAEAIISGTAVCDFSETGPWYASTRRTRGRVVIAGEDMRGLIGNVSIDESEDAISRTASFQLLDSRTAFFDPNSILHTGTSVQIFFMCDDYSSASEDLVFTGYLDASPNEGAYCPVATVRCLGAAGYLLQPTNGCIHLEAFSKMRRRDILVAFAASAGVTLTLPEGLFMTRVQKPVDRTGMSIEALLLHYCELENLFCRELGDGSIEFKQWSNIGPDASLYVDITEAMYVGSPREEPPNRPVTVYTAASSSIAAARTGPENPTTTLDEHATGIDADGNAWALDVWVTRQYGIELKTVREDRKMYAVLGTATAAASFKLTSRITTTTTYIMGRVYGMPSAEEFAISGASWLTEWDPDTSQWLYYFEVPTAQLDTVTEITEGWYAPLASTGSPELWTDGTHHPSAWTAQRFGEIARTIATYTYDADTCRLATQTLVTKGWYVRQATTGSPYAYDDGTYRSATEQSYIEVSRVADAYADNLADVELGLTADRVNRHTTATLAWAVTSHALLAGQIRPDETYALSKFESFVQKGTVGRTYHSETTIAENLDGSSTIVKQPMVAGTVPDPQVASVTTPQFTLSPQQVTISAYTELFPVQPQQEQVADAESLEELENVARRRLRKQLAVRETFNMPAMKGLRVLDPVTFTDTARTLATKQGHIEKLTRSFDTLNGWMNMQITLAVDPAGI